MHTTADLYQNQQKSHDEHDEQRQTAEEMHMEIKKIICNTGFKRELIMCPPNVIWSTDNNNKSKKHIESIIYVSYMK